MRWRYVHISPPGESSIEVLDPRVALQDSNVFGYGTGPNLPVLRRSDQEAIDSTRIHDFREIYRKIVVTFFTELVEAQVAQGVGVSVSAGPPCPHPVRIVSRRSHSKIQAGSGFKSHGAGGHRP